MRGILMPCGVAGARTLNTTPGTVEVPRAPAREGKFIARHPLRGLRFFSIVGLR